MELIHSHKKGEIKEMARETYSWLIGVELGEYIYNGKYWNDNGSCQYHMIAVNESHSWYASYREFKNHIDGFDLSEYKKQSRKGYIIVDC